MPEELRRRGAREQVEQHARYHNHGAVHRATALAAGMNPAQVDRRVRRRQWVPFGSRGWYLLASHADVPLSRLQVATTALQALAWGESALALFGLVEHPDTPVVAHNERYKGDDVRVIYVERLGRIPTTRVEGIETALLEFALASRAAALGQTGLHRLIDEALRAGLTTWDRVEAALTALPCRGRPGSTVMRAVHDDRCEDLSVPLSDWGREAVGRMVSSGLPRPRMEHRVVGPDGRLVAQVDLAYPDLRYAVELDSVQFHVSLEAFERDRQRDAELARVGWLVRRFTWNQWHRRWPWVLSTMRADLAARDAERADAPW